MKPIRHAVRVFLIKDDRVIVIKYKNKDANQNGYLDIPGGKIEDSETAKEAAIREFKEETGMIVKKLRSIGKLVVECPEKIFDFELFISSSYEGTPQSFFENDSMWCSIQDALNYSKTFPIIQLLKLNNRSHIDLKFTCDSQHNIIKLRKNIDKNGKSRKKFPKKQY